jgi:CDP-diglyceride synthetase
MYEKKKSRVLPAIVMILVVSVFVVANVLTGWPLVAALIIMVAVLCYLECKSLEGHKRNTRARCLVANQFGIVIAGTCACLVYSVLLNDSVMLGSIAVPRSLVVILLVIISTTLLENTISWFVGSRWSKVASRKPRPAYPVYSPNKTVVGVVFGVGLGAVIGVVLVTALSGQMEPGFYALLVILAITTPPLAEWGDWIESRMKRHVGVKDSNSLIINGDDGLLCRLERSMGGHGGLMDRTDSMFFCLAWSLPPVLIYTLLSL